MPIPVDIYILLNLADSSDNDHGWADDDSDGAADEPGEVA
jgi:hypothetical protein